MLIYVKAGYVMDLAEYRKSERRKATAWLLCVVACVFAVSVMLVYKPYQKELKARKELAGLSRKINMQHKLQQKPKIIQTNPYQGFFTALSGLALYENPQQVSVYSAEASGCAWQIEGEATTASGLKSCPSLAERFHASCGVRQAKHVYRFVLKKRGAKCV